MGFREDFFKAFETSLSKYTQAELAAMTGVAQGQVSKVFGKNRITQNPGLKFVAAILDDLNMTIYPKGSVGAEAAAEVARLQEDLKKKNAEIQQMTIDKHKLEGQVEILRDMLNETKATESSPPATFQQKTSAQKM